MAIPVWYQLLLTDRERFFMEMPRESAIKFFDRIVESDHGVPMNQFAVEMAKRIKEGGNPKCNLGGLLLSMEDALCIFTHKEQLNAVQRAIPALIDKMSNLAVH